VLQEGVGASGSVGFRKWTYYHFDLVLPGQEATVRMHETNSLPVHDCDLFAQVDDYPTRRRYFRKDTGVGRDALINLNGTAPRGTLLWQRRMHGRRVCVQDWLWRVRLHG
jgi:hypothetical protein